MARGYSRKTEGTRATFVQMGGMKVYASHPMLLGQLADKASTTIELSSSTELDSEFFTARPMLDSSKMKIMVSGDTVQITNNVSAGTIDVRMLESTGSVYLGDPIACIQFVRDAGDTLGWVITVKRFVNGICRQTTYTGCALVSIPQKILAGNDVPTYEASFSYTNAIEAELGTADSSKDLQAVGNNNPISGVFKPFNMQERMNGVFTNTDTANGIKTSQVGNDNTDSGNDNSVEDSDNRTIYEP